MKREWTDKEIAQIVQQDLNDAAARAEKIVEKRCCAPVETCQSSSMTTTVNHKEKVQELRSIIKGAVCKTLRVVMSKGSAWGNVKIKGSGEFGMFSDAEKAALTAYNFNFGANCGIIMYEDVDACIERLHKQIEAEGAARRAERDAQDAALRERVSNMFQPRHINISAIKADGLTMSKQIWATRQDDIDDAEKQIVRWVDSAEYGELVLAAMHDMKTLSTRCFKVRGKSIYDITDEVCMKGVNR